jgi:hypothetical protein
MKIFLSILLFLTFVFCTNEMIAQNLTPSIDTIKYPRPKVLLFMLHLSTNKINALKRRGMHEDIPAVMQYDAEINNSIIADFASHFTFCPVYFFYDTAQDLAVKKQFSEIEFYDYESLSKKKKIATNQFDTYYFAEVSYSSPDAGLPIDSTQPIEWQDGSRGDQDVVASRNYGIHMYNENFDLLRNKLGFTDIALRPTGPILRKKKMVFTGAAKFDKKLRRLYPG